MFRLGFCLARLFGINISPITPPSTGPSGDALLLESGDFYLLETGDALLLE